MCTRQDHRGASSRGILSTGKRLRSEQFGITNQIESLGAASP